MPGSGQGPAVTVTLGGGPRRRIRPRRPRGAFRTDAARDHTVKLDATGLEPGTDYFFRFAIGDDTSPVGRTRTAPAPGSSPKRLRFGVVSCANWQAGWFSSYRHLAERGDLDAVIHLGDYLYEYQPGKYSYGHLNEDIRRHDPPRGDREPARLSPPARAVQDRPRPPGAARRRAVHRHVGRPRGRRRQLGARRVRAPACDRGGVPRRRARRAAGVRRVDAGADIGHRDTGRRVEDLSPAAVRAAGRTCRCSTCGAIEASGSPRTIRRSTTPVRTITGGHQLAWLAGNLATSPCRWKLVGNPVMIAPVRLPPRPAIEEFALSQTVSFTPSRSRRRTPTSGTAMPRTAAGCSVASRRTAPEDVVFLTGDVHTAWANEVPGPSGSVGRVGVRVQLDHEQQRRRLHRCPSAHRLARARGGRSRARTPTYGS